MNNWPTLLTNFLKQAREGKDLKVSSYPKEYGGLKMRVSFGMGAPARIPWIAFVAPEMQVSKGFYPVYLYYKDFNSLILAYGVSETEDFKETWPSEVMSSAVTINSFFKQDVPRYGDSFVFKAYKVIHSNEGAQIIGYENGTSLSKQEIEDDLSRILDYYKKAVSIKATSPDSFDSKGRFFMEKQLEDFIVHNWDKTELGKKYDLVLENGEAAQQYPTDIGPIDILARDKKNKNYVVIELKRNQTSDDTVGQLTRYMGWIKEKKKDSGVKGVIICGEYDKKLDYALKMVPSVEIFLYQVDFKLREFVK
jgi:hypothetical protein